VSAVRTGTGELAHRREHAPLHGSVNGDLPADLAPGEQPPIDPATSEIRLTVTDPGAAAEAIRRLDAQSIQVAAVELHQPSLDDVFLALTGRSAESRSNERRQPEPHENHRTRHA